VDKTALKYQVSQVQRPLLTCYATVIFITLFFTLLSAATQERGVTFSVSGLEFASMIFIFVLALNSCRENLQMFIQNGRSRKTLFFSYLVSVAIISGVIALANLGLTAWGVDSRSLFETAYGGFFPRGRGLAFFLTATLWNFCLHWASALAGYMIACFYYRAAKGIKIAVSVGLPGLLFFALPLVDSYLTGGRISVFLVDLINLALGIGQKGVNNPFYNVVSASLLGAVFAAGSYLLLRGSPVKEVS
jgi:hypothetical protein